VTHATPTIGSRALFVIFDKVADTFLGHIIIERHPAPACRLFNQLLADKNSQLAQHPADFELVQIGFIEDSGQLLPIEPMVITSGTAWLSSQETSNA